MNVRPVSPRLTSPLRVPRAAAVGLLAIALWLPAPPFAAGHSPDPAMSWPLFAANDALEFRWMSNEVPPPRMRDAVVAAAGAATNSRGSRAPSITYAADGASTVEYGANVFCGVNGLACADAWHAPAHFHVAFRTHGHQFDWGRLQWCQLQTTITNGCFDIVNVAIDEFGHVLGLGHHVNLADQSDYLDAVVQTVSRARPKVGWDADVFGRCDVAKLQLRYDQVNTARPYSTCLDLPVALSMTVNDRSIRVGETVTFTVTLQVGTSSAYERLSGNLLSQRAVVLQRRVPGSSTWTTVATIPAVLASGTYQIRVSPTATYDWRGYFYKPAGEGLRASSSAPFSVTVSGGCTSGPCPQLPEPIVEQEGTR
ncbi:MAG TPA: hypothetical protein VFT20_02095 [Candidatus Limnocylindrales bacterium]|nr:hypothetical protein [Candidatus Limnocylindrales bacterium]